MQYDEDNLVVEDQSREGKTPAEETTPTAVELSAIAEGVAGSAVRAAGKLKALLCAFEMLAADMLTTLATCVTVSRSKTLDWFDSKLLDEDTIQENVSNVQWDTFVHSDVEGVLALLDKADALFDQLSSLHGTLHHSVSRDLEELSEGLFNQAVRALESNKELDE